MSHKWPNNKHIFMLNDTDALSALMKNQLISDDECDLHTLHPNAHQLYKQYKRPNADTNFSPTKSMNQKENKKINVK